jgi:hypothetical protein
MRFPLTRSTLIGTLVAGSLAFNTPGLVPVSRSATSPQTVPTGKSLIRPKMNPVVSPWAASVIEKRARDGRVKVWVYFTDKGFSDSRGFASAVTRQGIELSPRAAARRAKVGRNRVEFLDVPVYGEYVDRIVATGARLRQASRWLNAASFEVDVQAVPSLAQLPFVHKIDPVIGYKREPVKIEPPEAPGKGPRPMPVGQDPPAVDYGSSYQQLEQINVPAVHALGHKGQGVLVCMMDTGYRKDHTAFQAAYSQGRVLAERDFIFNDSNTQDEPGDQPGQHNHGTYTWSALGGEVDSALYGPAYSADFILAKTEDIRSETPVEEDYWTAGVEWADSMGASVISSSLVYRDWYTYANYDGDQAVSTIAADLAASLGIVVCNANGNYGPSSGSIGAPADADSILAVGAVNSSGNIAGFSSHGPTADGRIKPEVCARGVSTYCATASSTSSYSFVSGTSLSTPLVGGCAAVLLCAHPDWTPMQVREALMMTASQNTAPDNTYGWGIVDLLAAVNYETGQIYTPGDLNYDEAIDLLDINVEVDIVFFGSPFPDPPVSPDINLDGTVSSLDMVFLIDHVFRGGAAPPYPPK